MTDNWLSRISRAFISGAFAFVVVILGSWALHWTAMTGRRALLFGISMFVINFALGFWPQRRAPN